MIALFILVLFSPLILMVLWDLYKKKKRKAQGESEKPIKTIIWWQALLCGIVLVGFFIYMIMKSVGAFALPNILEFILYGAVGFSAFYVAKKKVVFRKQG